MKTASSTVSCSSTRSFATPHLVVPLLKISSRVRTPKDDRLSVSRSSTRSFYTPHSHRNSSNNQVHAQGSPASDRLYVSRPSTHLLAAPHSYRNSPKNSSHVCARTGIACLGPKPVEQTLGPRIDGLTERISRACLTASETRDTKGILEANQCRLALLVREVSERSAATRACSPLHPPVHALPPLEDSRPVVLDFPKLGRKVFPRFLSPFRPLWVSSA